MLKKMFNQGIYLLNKNRENVDALNVFPVPDGDTGTNMSLTMDSASNEISKIDNITIESVAKAASNGSLMGARGNSGVILSQILRGFEKGCKSKEVLNVKDFANALKLASDTAYKAVMKPIEGTILTVIKETSLKALEISDKKTDFLDFFVSIIKHAEIILDKTPEQLPVLKQAGVVDAGGKGLIYILNGFYEALLGKENSEEGKVSKETINVQSKIYEKEDIEFGYCTEFIIKGATVSSLEFKETIKDLGDSLIVVGDEDLIKIHIHTNNPGNVIEKALIVGELINIKIDNMRHQHENRIINTQEVNKDEKDFGFLAVVMGEGLHKIFSDLNVDKIIQGGQTMNPSTEDIVKAVEEINAKNIFIYPNNSNIILAAKQAKEICDKNIIIIPTKTIPQGITSILQFDPNATLEDNISNMTEVLEEVQTIQVTYSVRDSKFENLDIKKGDILGLHEGKIKSIGDNIEDVSIDVITKSINQDDCEILTLYYGDEVSESQAQSLVHRIEENYPDLDVEMYYGGQPLYYYIISVE